MKKNKFNFKSIFGKNGRWYLAAAFGCFLFPVGIILSIVNLIPELKHLEKNRAIVRSGIAVLVFAIFMAGTMMIGGRGIFTGSTFIVLAVYYGGAAAAGVLMVVIYVVLSARAKRMKFCLMLVQNEHITSIPKIAQIMGMSHDKTVSLLKKLISMDKLSGAAIDGKLDEVVFGKSIWARQRVICRNCGADLVVNFGQTLICEYCGGKLETMRPRKFVEIEE